MRGRARVQRRSCTAATSASTSSSGATAESQADDASISAPSACVATRSIGEPHWSASTTSTEEASRSTTRCGQYPVAVPSASTSARSIDTWLHGCSASTCLTSSPA